jgi:hypothetical protein
MIKQRRMRRQEDFVALYEQMKEGCGWRHSGTEDITSLKEAQGDFALTNLLS